GIAVFCWGGLAHMVLGLGGDSTMKRVPDNVMASMASNMKDGGLYMYPYTKDMNEMAKLVEKNPYGIMVFTPAGTPMNAGTGMLIQAAGDILASMLAAFLFSLALPNLKGWTSRVGFVVGIVMFSFLVSEVPYWNWYRYPTDFTAFSLLFKVVSSLVLGVILT